MWIAAGDRLTGYRENASLLRVMGAIPVILAPRDLQARACNALTTSTQMAKGQRVLGVRNIRHRARDKLKTARSLGFHHFAGASRRSGRDARIRPTASGIGTSRTVMRAAAKLGADMSYADPDLEPDRRGDDVRRNRARWRNRDFSDAAARPRQVAYDVMST
jgi:hypothetical protein